MKQSTFKKALSWMLVLYFMAFIVPPVSSFAEAKPLQVSMGRSLSKEPCRQHTRLLLVDLLIWEQITQTKRTDTPTIILGDNNEGRESGRLLVTILDLFAENARASFRQLPRHERFQATPWRSRLPLIRYARSGISPPHLS